MSEIEAEPPGDVESLLSAHYSERQLIVVTDDPIVEAAAQVEQRAADERDPSGVDWKRITVAILRDVLPIPFSATLGEAALEAFRAWGRARQSGLRVLQVGKSQAAKLSFPPGHPRDGVLYIGHPALPPVYYTLADFHRVTFEHKFCEAITILMGLGASYIRAEHVRGWSKEFSAKLSVPLADMESNVGASAGGIDGHGVKILYEANLPGENKPELPQNLAWYAHEPTWQSIATGRLKYGLRDFSLAVSYEDDFGINAGLKATVSKAGLEVGGSFEDHESTVWRLEGRFGESTRSE